MCPKDWRSSSAFKASISARTASGGGVSLPPKVGSIAVNMPVEFVPSPASRSTSLESRIQFWRSKCLVCPSLGGMVAV